LRLTAEILHHELLAQDASLPESVRRMHEDIDLELRAAQRDEAERAA
jgi:uncharacterized protein (UPF0147 family)